MNKLYIGLVVVLVLSAMTCYSNAQMDDEPDEVEDQQQNNNGFSNNDDGLSDDDVDSQSDNEDALSNDDDDDIVAEEQQAGSWTKVGGSLKHVSTSINYYWGVNSRDQIFRCNRPVPLCTRWIHVAGVLSQVDVSDMEVWGVNSAHYIYKRSVDGAGGWIRVGGRLKHVSASGNGYVWGVNSGDNIYRCKKPCNGAWTQVPGKLKQIDGGEKFVFGANSANNVYRRNIDGSGGWSRINGSRKIKYVSVGADAVYGVGALDGHVYKCALPCSYPRWTKVSGCQNLKQVEAAVGELIGTTSTTIIYRRTV